MGLVSVEWWVCPICGWGRTSGGGRCRNAFSDECQSPDTRRALERVEMVPVVPTDESGCTPMKCVCTECACSIESELWPWPALLCDECQAKSDRAKAAYIDVCAHGAYLSHLAQRMMS